MHTAWTFGYMASYLGAHLVDVNGVAARARNMVNSDETTLVLTNQSDTVDRAVCDVEVLREMKKAKKAVKKVTCEGQKRFLRVKCLFTGFANGASSACHVAALPARGHSVGAVHGGRKWRAPSRCQSQVAAWKTLQPGTQALYCSVAFMIIAVLQHIGYW